MTAGRCELCRREVPRLTAHHLIPRSTHRRKAVRAAFDRNERLGRIAMLCPPCHKQIHAILDERSMARDYHSVSALLAHPDIARFVDWVARRPGSSAVTVHRPKRRR